MYDSSSTALDRSAIRGALRDMATRMDNAYASFAASLVELGGISPQVAPALARWYVRKRLATLNKHSGTITVKHGGLLERDAIHRALLAYNMGEAR